MNSWGENWNYFARQSGLSILLPLASQYNEVLNQHGTCPSITAWNFFLRHLSTKHPPTSGRLGPWSVVLPALATFFLLPSATKLREGNVFTPVCDSVHRGGGSLSRGGISVGGGLCPGRGGVSVQEGGCLCPGRGSLSRKGGGLCPGRGRLCPGGSLSGRPPGTVTCGRYASFWNAFLF